MSSMTTEFVVSEKGKLQVKQSIFGPGNAAGKPESVIFKDATDAMLADPANKSALAAFIVNEKAKGTPLEAMDKRLHVRYGAQLARSVESAVDSTAAEGAAKKARAEKSKPGAKKVKSKSKKK